MTQPWWVGIAPAEVEVDCAGDSHRIRWADGALDTLDHADPDGERTLAALGGDPCECIQIFDAWARHCEDVDVLVLASRGVADLVSGEPQSQGTHRRGVMSSRSLRRNTGVRWSVMFGARGSRATPAAFSSGGGFSSVGSPSGRSHGSDPDMGDDIEALLRLGGGLPHRLVATIVASWAERVRVEHERIDAVMPALHAALYGRALAAIGEWLGESTSVADVTMCGPGVPATASRDADGLRFDLPFAWLAEVWAKGLTTVAGRFCLTATIDEPGTWTLSTVAPDIGPPRTITISVA